MQTLNGTDGITEVSRNNRHINHTVDGGIAVSLPRLHTISWVNWNVAYQTARNVVNQEILTEFIGDVREEE